MGTDRFENSSMCVPGMLLAFMHASAAEDMTLTCLTWTTACTSINLCNNLFIYIDSNFSHCITGLEKAIRHACCVSRLV